MFGWWKKLVRWVVQGKDHERALALELIARGCAALVVSMNPNAKWAHLVELVVKQIASLSGKPTTSAAAIHRAAIAALMALGRDPSR
jgi:hypothetical protein